MATEVLNSHSASCGTSIHVYTCMCSIYRDIPPSHGFVLLNRLSSDNLQEMVVAGSEYRVQGVFVLFKKHSGIYVHMYMYIILCIYMYFAFTYA